MFRGTISLLAGAILALSLFTAAPSRATPLGITLFDFPDIMSAFIDVTYDAAGDSLIASGTALELDDDGVGPPLAISGGSFDLSASIDDTGTLVGGTLSIGGTVAALGFSSGTLLTGDLLAFGFPDAGGDPLEFLFNPTGGDAAGLFSGLPGGVILTGSSFGGSFTENFDNLIGGHPGTGSGVANTAPVPEPSALALLLAGGGLMRLWRRAGGARRGDPTKASP